MFYKFQHQYPDFTHKLLKNESERSLPSQKYLVEEPSEREMELLRLVSAGNEQSGYLQPAFYQRRHGQMASEQFIWQTGGKQPHPGPQPPPANWVLSETFKVYYHSEKSPSK